MAVFLSKLVLRNLVHCFRILLILTYYLFFSSQSLLKSPVSSQSTMEKSNKNSQNPKTLFSPNNITKFMKENKLPSQRQSISPLAMRSSNADSENQKVRFFLIIIILKD